MNVSGVWGRITDKLLTDAYVKVQALHSPGQPTNTKTTIIPARALAYLINTANLLDANAEMGKR
jgi:hypothetical protein